MRSTEYPSLTHNTITSITGLRGDRRPTTLGLLSLGVLVAGFGDETESASEPGVLSFRVVFGVAGDVLCGTSTETVLQQHGRR